MALPTPRSTPAQLRAKAQELVRRAPTCTVEELDKLYNEFLLLAARMCLDSTSDEFRRMEIMLLSVRYIYRAHEHEKLNPTPRLAVLEVVPHVHALTDVTLVPLEVQREMMQILEDPCI